eukprot:5996855-Pyramimonas_sp.AAC.1
MVAAAVYPKTADQIGTSPQDRPGALRMRVFCATATGDPRVPSLRRESSIRLGSRVTSMGES